MAPANLPSAAPAASALSPTESLLWATGQDPTLRSTVVTILRLGGHPDLGVLEERVGRAVAGFPRLGQRVVGGAWPWRGPRWEADCAFDLGYHLRRVALPAPGDERQLLDLAAALSAVPLDPERPPWQLTVVDGGWGQPSALVAQLEHVLTDGEGGMRLAAAFVDPVEGSSRLPRLPGSDGAVAQGASPPLPRRRSGWAERVAAFALSELPAALEGLPGTLARGPSLAPALAASLGRQLGPEPARSPLWSGRRSLSRRFEVAAFDLQRVRAAGQRAGATVNDVYLAAVVGGAAAYHRVAGRPVAALRGAIPVSTRRPHQRVSNAFVPLRALLPTVARSPLERLAAVHQVLRLTKQEPLLGGVEGLARGFSGLPPALLAEAARRQAATVDFAASNVRGSPIPLAVAGAPMLGLWAFGPTAGVAFNATLLSYDGRLDLGVNADTAAVDDPATLVVAIEEEMEQLLEAAESLAPVEVSGLPARPRPG